MAELKNQKNSSSVSAFIAEVDDEAKRKVCQELVNIFEKISGEKATMWGTSIIGFGSYHYKSERSKQEGDWPLTGFSPRKQNITIYIMCGFEGTNELLKKIGKHKVSGGSCLYIKRLSDIDLEILKQLITASLKVMKERYKVK